MKFLAPTLWHLLGLNTKPARPPAPKATASRRRRPIDDRYDALVEEMKRTYGFRVRKWRTSTSGCAWEVHYADGRCVRLLESPYPRGPVSCAVFLHEVGHHAIGFNRYRPRCLEEYHAWRWSLDAMRDHGFNITPAVHKRVHAALRYAVGKARRRGLRRIPAELMPYCTVADTVVDGSDRRGPRLQPSVQFASTISRSLKSTTPLASTSADTPD